MMDAAWKKYFDPQVLEQLRGSRLRSGRAADGMLVGAHRSPRSGQAVEFSEHRQYSPGDDLRGLDWKVLGRTDKYYLRQREDETTLDCHFLVDNTGSMSYRGTDAPCDKLTFAMRLVAALSFVAVENHDRSSLMTIGQTVQQRLPSGGGSGHLLALASAMEIVQADSLESEDGFDVTAQFLEGAMGLPARGLLFLVGDFFDPVDAIGKMLRALRFGNRPVWLVQTIDAAEERFPFGETIEFVGLEGELAITADARGIARAYREQFETHQQALRRVCLESGVTYWGLRSDQPLGYRLAELLAS